MADHLTPDGARNVERLRDNPSLQLPEERQPQRGDTAQDEQFELTGRPVTEVHQWLDGEGSEAEARRADARETELWGKITDETERRGRMTTPAPVLDAEPDQKGERRAEVRHPAQSPALMIAYRGPAARNEDTLLLDVIQYALAKGEGSRLVKKLVYDTQLAVSVGVDWGWRLDPGIVLFFLELKPDSDPRKVEEALYAELKRLVDEGLTEREAEIIALIARGLSNQEIADLAYLSINSVKTYIRTAYRKMGVTRRSQAVRWALEHGFVPDHLRVLEPTR